MRELHQVVFEAHSQGSMLASVLDQFACRKMLNTVSTKHCCYTMQGRFQLLVKGKIEVQVYNIWSVRVHLCASDSLIIFDAIYKVCFVIDWLIHKYLWTVFDCE